MKAKYLMIVGISSVTVGLIWLLVSVYSFFTPTSPMTGSISDTVGIKDTPFVTINPAGSVGGEITISNNGSFSLPEERSWLEEGEYEFILDIFGGYEFDGKENELILVPNTAILSLEKNSDITVVYGENITIGTFDKNYAAMTYQAAFRMERELVDITGSMIFIESIVEDQGNRRRALPNSFKINEMEVFDKSVDGSVMLIPDATISSSIFHKPDLSQPFMMADLSISEHRSINPFIELQADFHETNETLIFSVFNKGEDVHELAVSQWNIHRSIGGSGGYGYSWDQPAPITIPPNDSAVITTVDLSVDDHGLSEQITHEVDLRGLNWDEELSGNRDDYMIQVKVSYRYDDSVLAALGSNKLLKANNTLVIINGTGQPFEVDEESPKIVEIYIVNSGNTKISAVLSGDTFRVWPVSRTSIEESYSTIADSFGSTECPYLDAGEKIGVATIVMSKSFWPIGKNGLAEHFDSLTGVPGMYVMYYTGYTNTCTLQSGEKVPGGGHLLIAAFDVK